ncbi:MAG: hypothetical protein ACI3XM_02420 [Eubacteriales bacterium]
MKQWEKTCGSICFYVLFILFFLQDKLQGIIPLFQYFDEGFALLFVPLLVYRVLRRQRVIQRTKENVLFFVLLAFFWLCGWAGYLVYRYQPFVQAAKDAYVNIKFFLAAGASYLLFYNPHTDYAYLKQGLWRVLYVMSAGLFVMSILDAAFGIFSNDTRGGLPAVKLFYSAQTTLVGVCVLLCAMLLWFYSEKGNRILLPLGLLSCVMFSTLRVKAVGAIAVLAAVWLFVLHSRKKLTKKMKLCFVFVLVFAGTAGIYQAVRYYFLMGVESARAVLTIAAPFAAMDHFPTGCGWATFGSAFSAEPYSPVYGMYRMAGIWGISPNYHQFISDTYWPMVLAECGYFGFAALVGALVLFVRRLLGLKTDRPAFASALFVFLYLMISSTSESAFANPLAVPLAFWIGFLLARNARNPDGKGAAE